MKVIKKYWYIIPIIFSILGISTLMEVINPFIKSVDNFAQNTTTEVLEVKNDTLYVKYSNPPYPNCNYTTKYWIFNVEDLRNAYILPYADTINKNDFPLIFYKSSTTWEGDGIYVGKLDEGEYELHIKYFFCCNMIQKLVLPEVIIIIKFKL